MEFDDDLEHFFLYLMEKLDYAYLDEQRKNREKQKTLNKPSLSGISRSRPSIPRKRRR